MFGFLRTLLDHDGRSSEPPSRGLNQAIDRIVAGTDPRLALLAQHRRRLAPCAGRLLTHARACAAALTPPRLLSRTSFTRDPLIRACFSSADGVATTITRDPALRELLATPQGHCAPEFYALLSLSCTERAQFGLQLEGDIMRRDVRQTAVVFERPVFLAPHADEAACREAVMWTVFDYCVHRAREHLTGLRGRREALQTRYREQLGKLRMLDHVNGRRVVGLDGPERVSHRIQAEQALAHIKAELQQAVADVASLNDSLARVIEVLETPQQLVSMQRRCLRIDHRGVRIDDAASSADTVCFDEACFAGTQTRAAVLVRIPGLEFETPGLPTLPDW